jgi:histidinol-phosphatase (PHP family)
LLADYHVHSHFSADSQLEMETAVLKALSLGLQEIAFTDHVDYDYADPAFGELDYEAYLPFFYLLQKRYRQDIRMVLGVEIGYQPQVQADIARLVQEYPFDFVILSTHTADRQDFYTGHFFEGKSKAEAYRRYFECVQESVRQFKDFDVYGHLDFIERYGPYEDKSLHPSDYGDIVSEIFALLIESGRGLELNTSGTRYRLGHMHPQEPFLRRYREMGGEIITLGSDAHRAEDIAHSFAEARQILADTGFKYLCRYEQREPQFVKLR